MVKEMRQIHIWLTADEKKNVLVDVLYKVHVQLLCRDAQHYWEKKHNNMIEVKN